MSKFQKYICAGLTVTIVVLTSIATVQAVSEDTKAPEIQFPSDSIRVSINDDESVLLEGVTAHDQRDGDVTDSVMVENISDFSDNNSRTITYVAYDSSNNISKATRTVTYSDYRSPEFELSNDTTFYSSDSNINIAELLTANDVFDGDITAFMKLVDDDIVIGQGGQYSATISVYNSSGDSSTLNLPVFIESSTANSSAPVVNLNRYMLYVDKGETVSDWRQYIESVKNRSNSSKQNTSDKYKDLVEIDDSNVDYNTSGSYYVSYEYTNPSELTSVTRLIVVVR